MFTHVCVCVHAGIALRCRGKHGDNEEKTVKFLQYIDYSAYGKEQGVLVKQMFSDFFFSNSQFLILCLFIMAE